ncbi:adenosylcobinamide-GDP ribazoletransferase [Oscillatoria salina]|uniref:adenosylcobinamide-GDP ribazoletransferase n=1 Tax=Oscillatoria salina TaxID=331517 RepID=UPI0013BAB5AF|nr:adenosylcobinamide-GDP ribazoletransferase [Oscillatoria salina]MBZ8180063.1 adenosylcobinamide-GDP ribazoletransferase [Oscillatoria salina IIICB1]NET90901.1 adenosylcobinamide-GDP ribazoletransferase [Kamptonema sp. SIO1D9]
MREFQLHQIKELVERWTRSLLGAVIFYTVIPLPQTWQMDFTRVARWATGIGLLLGGLLGLLEWSLQWLGMPILTRSAVVVAVWLGLTGGLHLDGAMDTADGLAVLDKQRRLEVMQDSAAGAFGAIAAVLLLLLKTVALSDLGSPRWLALMAVAGWGRWGQVVAIAFYPYLKPTGKGAFHKETIRPLSDLAFGLVLLFTVSGVVTWLDPVRWWKGILLAFAGAAIAVITGTFFYWQFSGFTGDVYGAVVEWTEAIFLCLLTIFF